MQTDVADGLPPESDLDFALDVKRRLRSGEQVPETELDRALTIKRALRSRRATGNTPAGPDTSALAAGLESSRAYGGQGERDLASMFPSGQAPALVNPEPWRAADPNSGFNRPGGTGLTPEERMVGVQPNYAGMAPPVRSSVQAYYHNTGQEPQDRPPDLIPMDWSRRGQGIEATRPSGLTPEELAVQQRRAIRDIETQRYAQAMGDQTGGVVDSAIRGAVAPANTVLRSLIGYADAQGNPVLTDAVDAATRARPEGMPARIASGAASMAPVLTVGALGGTPALLGAMGAQSFTDAFRQYQADLERKGDLHATGKALAAAAAIAPLEAGLNVIPAHRFLGALERAAPGFGAFLRARAVDAAVNAGIGAAADLTRQAGGVASGAQDQIDLRQTLEAMPEQAAVGGVVGAATAAHGIGARGERMGQIRDVRQAQADARATGGAPEQAGAYQPRPVNPWDQNKAAPSAPIGRGDTTAQVPDGAGPPAGVKESFDANTRPPPEERPVQNGERQPGAGGDRGVRVDEPANARPLDARVPPVVGDQGAPAGAESRNVDGAPAVDLYPRARQILDEIGVPDSGEVADRLGITLPEADRLVGRWEAEGRTPAPATGDTPEGTAAQDAGSSDVAGRSPESSRDVPSQKERPSPNSTRPALGSSGLNIPLSVVSESQRQADAARENIARQSRPFAPPGRAAETERRAVMNRVRNPDGAGYSTEGSLTPEGVFPKPETPDETFKRLRDEGMELASMVNLIREEKEWTKAMQTKGTRVTDDKGRFDGGTLIDPALEAKHGRVLVEHEMDGATVQRWYNPLELSPVAPNAPLGKIGPSAPSSAAARSTAGGGEAAPASAQPQQAPATDAPARGTKSRPPAASSPTAESAPASRSSGEGTREKFNRGVREDQRASAEKLGERAKLRATPEYQAAEDRLAKSPSFSKKMDKLFGEVEGDETHEALLREHVDPAVLAMAERMGRPVPAEVLKDYPELGGKEGATVPKNGERIVNGHLFDHSGVPVNFTHTGDKVPIAFDRQKTATDYLKSIKKPQRDTLEAVQGPSGRWWLVNKSGRVEAPPESSLSKVADFAARKAAALKAAPDIRQAGKGFKGKGGRAGASDLGRVASYAAWKAVELGAKAGEKIRVTVEQAIEHLKRFGVDTTEANAKRVAKMANAWIGSAEKPDGTIDPGRLESAREAGMRRTRIAAAIGETKIRLSEQGKAARVAFNKGLAEGRRTAIDKLSNAADAEGTSRKAVLDIVKALPVGSRGRIEYVSLIARAKTLNDVREAARMVAFDLHREVVKQQLKKTERLAKYKNLTPELKADLATVNKDVAASLKGMAPQWTIREALAGKKKGDMIAARVPMKLSDAETTAGQVQLAVGAIAQKIATHRLDLKIAAEDQARTADYLAQNVAGRVSAQTPDTWTPIWGRDRTARAKFLGAWSRLGYTVQQLGKLLDNTQGKPEQGYAETLLFRRPLEGEGRVAGEMQRTMDTLDELARKHGYKSFLEAEDEAANNYIDDTPLGRITWEEALTIAGLDPETKALFEQGAKVVPHGDVNKAPDQLDQERQKRITDKLPERAVKLYRDAKRAIYEEQYRDRALREIEVLTGTRPPTIEDYQPRRSLQQHNFESGVVNGSPDGIITVEHMLDAQRLERASFGKERIAGPNATFVVEPAYVVMKRQAARAAKIIHLARAVRDARSVFARQEVQHAIQRTFGRGAWRAVQRQIKQMSMLNPMSHDVGFSRTMKAATRNVGRALTQLNPASFLRQYGTVFNAMHDFGWARGVAALRFGASGKLRAEMIASHPLLRQRYETGQGFQTAQAVGGAGRPTKAGSLDTEGLRVALKGINRDIRRGDLAGAWRNISSGFDAIKLNNIADAQVATVVYGMAKEDARAAHPEASEERIRELAGEATALWVHRRANTSSSNSSGLWVNNVRDNPSFSPLALFTSDRTKIFNMIVDAKHEGKAKTASAVAASGLNALWSQSVGRVYRNVALYALASALWGSEAEEEKKNLWGRNFIAAVATDMLGSLPGGDAIGKAADAALSAKKGELDSLLSNPVTDTADAMYGIVVKALSAMTKPAVELERDKAGGVTVESLLKAEKSAQSWSGLFAKAFDASATLAGLPFAVARRDLSKLLPEKSIGGAFDKAAAQYGRGEMDYATETVARTYKAMLDGGVRPKAARDALVSRLSYRLGKDAKDKPAQKRAEIEAKKLVNAGITKANE